MQKIKTKTCKKYVSHMTGFKGPVLQVLNGISFEFDFNIKVSNKTGFKEPELQGFIELIHIAGFIERWIRTGLGHGN